MDADGAFYFCRTHKRLLDESNLKKAENRLRTLHRQVNRETQHEDRIRVCDLVSGPTENRIERKPETHTNAGKQVKAGLLPGFLESTDPGSAFFPDVRRHGRVSRALRVSGIVFSDATSEGEGISARGAASEDRRPDMSTGCLHPDTA